VLRIANRHKDNRMEQATTSSPRWALAGLSLTMLMPSFATSSANAALPALAKTFGASFQAAQWIVLSYLVTVTGLTVVVGRLGDMFGRRRLLLAGVALFAAASLLCAVAPVLELLIAARVIQGAGAAIMMALTLAFVGDVVPAARTGAAMGVLGTMSAVGTTVGPALGGLLIAWGGGRAIFIVNIPLGLLALMLAYRALPADRAGAAATHMRFDSLGMALLIFALVAYALSMTAGHGHPGIINIAALAAAVTATAALLVVEGRAAAPLVRLGLFSNASLGAGLATSAIVSTVMMATLVVGPFYLSAGLGLRPVAVGLILSAGPFIAALVGIPAGRLVDRYGSYRSAIAGLIALAAGAAVVALLPATLGVVGYVLPIAGMTAVLFAAWNRP
jgi:MFS family permease